MNISSKAVINSVNQLQIWSDIFGKTVSLNTKYCNPLRVDKNPGCWLKKVGNKVYLIDYGCSRFHYIDIFKAVEIRYNLKVFSQVIDKVIDIHVYGNNKVNFEKIDSYKATKKFKFKLEYRLSEFDDIQNQYWSRRGITLSQLESDNIKFTNCYRCNTRNHQDELFYFYPRMAYVITFESGNKKIVIPNSKQRFITDANAEDIGGVWDMNGEQIVVTKDTLLLLQKQLQEKHRIIAVGTTSTRTLESIYWMGVQLQQSIKNPFYVSQWVPYQLNPLPEEMVLATLIDYCTANNIDAIQGSTQLIIVPSYTFKFISGILTNFHQPQSTLLLLIAAFLGDAWKDIYAHALNAEYRFLSYGDCCLFLR